MKTIVTLETTINATLLRWGTHPIPNCDMLPGEYVRIAPRTWALWLGSDRSVKYIYHIPRK